MTQLAAAGVVPAVGHTDADAAPPGPRWTGCSSSGLGADAPWSPTSSTACRRCTIAHPARSPRRSGPRAAARPSSRSSATGSTSRRRRCGCSSRPSVRTVCALITDAMAASGMPEGRYTLGGREVVVEDRTARLADGGSIAGGVATLLEVVRWCVAEVGVPLADAVTAASRTPAAVLGLDRHRRARGRPAGRPARRRRRASSRYACCAPDAGWLGGEARDACAVQRLRSRDRAGAARSHGLAGSARREGLCPARVRTPADLAEPVSRPAVTRRLDACLSRTTGST